MKELELKILKDGKVLPGDVLKVGSFLNQLIDTELLGHMANEVSELFKDNQITKVLTIEASGIAFATAVALKLNVPMVYAKKHKSLNVSGDQLTSTVFSYTHNESYEIAVTKEYISPNDKVLICDDFLANGNALKGLIEIVTKAGASVVGCSCEIEKGFQGGGDELRAKGLKIESLAVIEKMDNGTITFR